MICNPHKTVSIYLKFRQSLSFKVQQSDTIRTEWNTEFFYFILFYFYLPVPPASAMVT